jgi:hypothetical protein
MCILLTDQQLRIGRDVHSANGPTAEDWNRAAANDIFLLPTAKPQHLMRVPMLCITQTVGPLLHSHSGLSVFGLVC